MELKDFIKNILKNKLLLIVSILLGVMMGVIYLALPPKYIATGSFMVIRKANTQRSGFFTYEGYYNQQTALSFTETVTALMESEDVLSKTLGKMAIDVNKNSLRKIQKKIKVKNPGPQLVTLQVKEKSNDLTLKTWEAISEVTTQTAQEANIEGDPSLGIAKVSAQPVIKKQHKPALPIILGGAILGLTVYIFFVSVKEYSR